MKSIKLSLLLVAISIFVFAYKKETASPTKSSPPTKTEILAEGKWQNSTTLATPPIDINGKMVTNICGYIKACELVNYYTFTKNKTYALNNGAKKCDTNEEDIKAKGTWQITADDKYLYSLPIVVQTVYY